jgi:GH35 family endo-1,4-beta-xylanase
MKHFNLKFKKVTILCSMFLLIFAFQLKAQTLRQIAESKGKYIGNLMKDNLISNNNLDGGAPGNILRDNFNMLVTENALKMENIIPNRPVNPFNIQVSDLNRTQFDNFVAFANARNMRKRGHAMIWYSQAPAWLKADAKSWTAQQIRDFSKSYIKALATLGAGKIDEWDVVNEMFEQSYNSSNYRKLGDEQVPQEVWYINIGDKNNQVAYNTAVASWIKDCFRWARQSDAGAELFYNDFTIEARSWAKAVAAETLCKNMVSEGVPIDGVGFQTHFTTTNFTNGTIADVVTSIREYAKSGLNVHITELDIRQDAVAITGTQAHDGYYNLVSSVFKEPNCTGILLWGIRDNDSWIPAAFPGKTAYLLYNSTYGQNGSYSTTGVVTKGAWTGFRDGMGSLANATFPPASLVGNGNPETLGAATNQTIAPVGQAISIFGNNAKFVSSENGAATGMNCNRATVGGWERFTVVNAGNGKVALKGTNGRYASSENGLQAMRCDRTTIGTSEAFDWVSVGGNNFQLKGNNGKFVSSENGAVAMTCTKATAGTWETFNWASNGVAFKQANSKELVSETVSSFDFYPNPATSIISVDLPDATTALRIIDLTGRLIKEVKTKGENKIEIELNIPNGIYLLNIENSKNSESKKLIVQ